MRAAIGLASLWLAFGSVSPAGSAAQPTRPCISPTDLLSPVMFRRYPAGPTWRGRWRAPDVRFGEAHLYRTVLRAEGIGPPDLAGHYKVVRLGCGAGMICPLFLDLATGKVRSVPALESIEWNYEIGDDVGKDVGIEDTRLVYRRDSRLLVALGTRNETKRLAGVTLFEWRDGGPRLIRFVPQHALCASGGRR